MGAGAWPARGPRRARRATTRSARWSSSELDRANANYARVEQIKKFAILDHDLSVETGELTPTLKVKRNVINERYEQLFDSMYT